MTALPRLRPSILNCENPAGRGRDADVVFAVFAEAFAAHVLVAFLAVGALDSAAFIAQEFHLLFLCVGEGVQLLKFLVEPEIRNDVAEFFAGKLAFELREFTQHLCRGGDKVESWIICL